MKLWGFLSPPVCKTDSDTFFFSLLLAKMPGENSVAEHGMCSLLLAPCADGVAPAVDQGVQAEDARGLGRIAVGGQQEPRHCGLPSSAFYSFLFL